MNMQIAPTQAPIEIDFEVQWFAEGIEDAKAGRRPQRSNSHYFAGYQQWVRENLEESEAGYIQWGKLKPQAGCTDTDFWQSSTAPFAPF